MAEITFTLETIPPAEAERILTEHDEAQAAGLIINRPRHMQAIRKYADDLASGRWIGADTAEPIKFDTLDPVLIGQHLLDGQNRLTACVVAQVPLTAWVARGVPRAAFVSLDSGDRRGIADTFHIARETHAPWLAVMMNWLRKWDSVEGRIRGGAPLSNARALAMFQSDDAGIRHSLQVAEIVATEKPQLLSAGVAAFLHYIFAKHGHEELATAFIQAVAVGAELKRDDPFFTYRKRLELNEKSKTVKMHTGFLIEFAIKAWNAKVAGRTLAKYVHSEESPRLRTWVSSAPAVPSALGDEPDDDGATLPLEAGA